MFFISWGIYESNGTLIGVASQEIYRSSLNLQFSPVSMLELPPLCWVVTEPFAKLRAGGDVLQPQIQ
jgi:hypothetical protein